MPDQSWQLYWVLGGMAYAIAMGVVGAYVAAQKGRPEIEGVILAVLMGPLGAILVACLPDRAIEGGTTAAEDEDEDQAVRRQLAAMSPPALPRAASGRLTPRRLLGEVED